MSEIFRTVFYGRHVELGGVLVEFGGWKMPIQYPSGIVAEHLATRKGAGLFDVAHMGRFVIKGEGALGFLQRVLTNNAAALEVGESQYTMIGNESGGALDDAYLYRFAEDEFLLVVNAANRGKDWDHFQAIRESEFSGVEIEDRTEALAMISLQGPSSRTLLEGLIEEGSLPEPMRNKLSSVVMGGVKVDLARTGYTGEPICFELFMEREGGLKIWDILVAAGAEPIGLGARDTLRLEAGLPLYGHELGADPEGKEIPIFACPLGRFAVSFAGIKGEFIGRKALKKQFAAYRKLVDRDYLSITDLPRRVRPVALLGKGVARAGAVVYRGDKQAGFISSGTMVPYWKVEGEGLESRMTDEKGMRCVGLALLDSDIEEGDRVEVELRGKRVEAMVVAEHLNREASGFCRAVIYG